MTVWDKIGWMEGRFTVKGLTGAHGLLICFYSLARITRCTACAADCMRLCHAVSSLSPVASPQTATLAQGCPMSSCIIC